MTSENLRICIPIPPKHEGGMYTFLENWRVWLDSQGIAHTDDINGEFDVLFVNSWAVPERVVKHVKKQRPSLRIVQRVDGSGQDYGRFDDSDLRQARVNLWADLTIFQSSYSRFSTTQKYKVISQNGPIIYNPVNTDLFRPATTQKSLTHLTVCNVSYSTNPKKGTWQIGELAQQNPDVKFVLCGRYPKLPNLPNIHLKGHLARQKLAQVIRESHVFLHLAENDPCPNVVIEALASGLPVLYKDSGGTPELVGNCGLPIEISTFRQQIEKIQQNYDEYAQRARQRAENHFAPDIIFPQYLAAITQTQRKPSPTVSNNWRLFREGFAIYPRQFSQVTWSLKRHLAEWKQQIR